MKKSTSSQSRKRVEWIDGAKGIAILLTIVGHTVVSRNISGALLRGMIFSFHMPLFFILSMATYHASTDWNQFKSRSRKSARHLLIPAYLTFIITCLNETLRNKELLLSAKFWAKKMFSAIFASGVKLEYAGIEISAMGIPWFFLALLFGKIIFDAMQLLFTKENVICYSLILSLIGILSGRANWYYPFSLDIVLAVMPFFCLGYYGKQINLVSNAGRKLIISFFSWAFLLLITFPKYSQRTYLELACRRYGMWPVTYICAIAGTLFIVECSILLQKGRLLKTVFNYIGKNSLYLLCIHIIDGIWKSIWYVEGHQYISICRRTFCDMSIFALIMSVLYMRTKFAPNT